MKYHPTKIIYGLIGTGGIIFITIFILGLISKNLRYSLGKVTNLVATESNVASILDADSGLIGWWKLDEGSGNSVSDSARSNTGTLNNNPTWTSGQIGTGAVQFDGIDDYIDLTDNYAQYIQPSIETAAEDVSSFSISVWVKRIATKHVSKIIFGKPGSNSGILESQFTVWSTNGGQKTINYSVPLNTWYLATMTYDNQTHILTGYINGVVVGTVDMTGLIFEGNTNNLIIGGTAGWNFTGLIDDARIYDRALTANEVYDIYTYIDNNQTPVSSDTQLPSTLKEVGEME